ncbi:MAG: integration host factor, actinobacterial type [Actinomycetota bacterium]
MSVNNLSKGDRQKGWLKSKRVRKKRASIKKSLKRRETDLSALFADKELFNEYIANMKVIDLISALPDMEKVRAKQILEDKLNISTSKKVNGLGKKQQKKFYDYFNIGI